MPKTISIPEQKGAEQKVRLKDQIDTNLRRVYDTALQQEIPDKFHDLLEQLRQSQAADPSSPPSVPGSRAPGRESNDSKSQG